MKGKYLKTTTIEKLHAFLARSSFMAHLAAALESKTSVAMILGVMDNVATIRDMFGLISCDGALQIIEQMLHERFGDYSVRGGDVFLILVTGNEATKAGEIAESVRTTVETISPTLDGRFHVTLHFGVTHGSSRWRAENGFYELLKAADEAICIGQRKLIENRVYEPIESSE
jgi:diguanylate cyclase (GGDEF)-like protein